MTVVRGMISTWPGRILALFLVAVVGGGALMVSGATAAPAKAEYRTAEVSRATVTQTVTVSGSVNPAAQVRLNFRSAGRLSDIYVSVGQTVTANQPLAKIETTDLENALAQAQANLANAQTSYQKQVQALADAQRSLDNAKKNGDTDTANAQQALSRVKSNYATAKTNYLSLSSGAGQDVIRFQASIDSIKTQLDAVLTELLMSAQADIKTAQGSIYLTFAPIANASANSTGLLQSSFDDYQSARAALLAALNDFDAAVAAGTDTASAASSYQLAQTSYTIAASRLSSALDMTVAPLAGIQSNVASAQSALQTSITKYIGPPFDQWRADLQTLYNTLTTEQQRVSTTKLRISQAGSSVTSMGDIVSTSYATALQNVSATIDRTQQAIDSAQSALASKPADVQGASNSVALQQTALQTAQTNLDNATLRATVAGVVQAVNGQVGEPASQSTTSPVVTLANTASIQLHGTIGEADVAKLKLGQVANITVDALAGARMTGKITGLDAVATIQQGVPVYGVDVTLDVPNPSVKPGMSGSAAVILASKTNVLTVPNLAIRTVSGRRVVQVLKDGQPVDLEATFGLANDTVTEVTAGLTEGMVVVLPQPRAGATTRPGQGFGGPGIPFR